MSALGSMLSTPTGEVGAPGDWRPSGRVREYWIVAESYPTDLAPDRVNSLNGEPITLKTAYVGLRYRACSANWERPLPGSAALGTNDGVPGAIIRGEVGDLILIHFKNADTHYGQPHSMHPHGVFYDLDSDGSWVAVRPGLKGASVPVGGTYTYRWQCRKSSVGTWVYHDHSVLFGVTPQRVISAATHKMSETNELNARAGVTAGARQDRELISETAIPNGLANSIGLIGFVVVTERGAVRPTREFFVAMHELHRFDLPDLWDAPDKPPETNEQIYALNGRSYASNTPVFRARVGDHVRWHVTVIGTPFRGFRIDGRRWWDGYRFSDRAFFNSSQTVVIDYVEQRPGEWIYGDHIWGHYHQAAGRYIVSA